MFLPKFSQYCLIICKDQMFKVLILNLIAFNFFNTTICMTQLVKKTNLKALARNVSIKNQLLRSIWKPKIRSFSYKGFISKSFKKFSELDCYLYPKTKKVSKDSSDTLNYIIRDFSIGKKDEILCTYLIVINNCQESTNKKLNDEIFQNIFYKLTKELQEEIIEELDKIAFRIGLGILNKNKIYNINFRAISKRFCRSFQNDCN